MRVIKERSIGLTICPLSNLLIGIYTKHNHPLKALLDAGLIVSIHSDDPAFFSGYIDDNYRFAYKELQLSLNDLVQSARNSFIGSFASDDRKDYCLCKLEEFVITNFNQSEN
jgi:adenosine deaminase